MMKEIKREPRLLVLSNECLSQTTSNGRTLRNLLLGWDSDSVAQFHIREGQGDYDVCKHYFCVTDRRALEMFLGRTGCRSCFAAAGRGESPGKHALTMLAREFVWRTGRWVTQEFRDWIDGFAPELVLLQAGDCAFMFLIAAGIAKARKIPLVIYNSEGYYFKDHDYFRGKGPAHWSYPLFRNYYRGIFEQTMQCAALSVYPCDPLKQAYDAAFGLPSVTLHTATEMRPDHRADRGESFVVSYLGNLGVGRAVPLMEIGRVLQRVSEAYHLDVYGKIPDDDVKAAFEACPGIRYQGFVPYEKVTEIMRRSDVLVHAENFDAFYREDIKFGFSTKIADSLASGTCFVLFAPEELACSRYLSDHEAAYVVTGREDLEDTFRRLAQCPPARGRYLERACKLVLENHDARKNAERFRTYLCEIVEGQP